MVSSSPSGVRRVRPAAVALVLLVSLTACTASSDDPELVVLGHGMGATVWDWGADEPLSLSRELRVCLDAPGPVRIVDVSMEYVEHGLQVADFAVMPDGQLPPLDGVADDPMTLPEAGYVDPAVSTQVEAVCYEDGGGWDEFRPTDAADHLGIQFSKPHGGTAGGSGLVITYETQGRVRSVQWNLRVILCGEADSPSAPGEAPAAVCDEFRMAEAASLADR